jgi:hypothetical protein
MFGKGKDLHSPNTRTNPLAIAIIIIGSMYALYWVNLSQDKQKADKLFKEVKASPAGALFYSWVELRKEAGEGFNFPQAQVELRYYLRDSLLGERKVDFVALPLPDSLWADWQKKEKDSVSFRISDKNIIGGEQNGYLLPVYAPQKAGEDSLKSVFAVPSHWDVSYSKP